MVRAVWAIKSALAGTGGGVAPAELAKLVAELAHPTSGAVLPAPETVVFGCDAPRAPVSKHRTKPIHSGKRYGRLNRPEAGPDRVGRLPPKTRGPSAA
jgi:hypothetical protein